MKLRPGLEKVAFDPRPVCYVCGRFIDDKVRYVHNKRNDGTFETVTLVIKPLKLGGGLYRHDDKKCKPGSRAYIKKFGKSGGGHGTDL